MVDEDDDLKNLVDEFEADLESLADDDGEFIENEDEDLEQLFDQLEMDFEDLFS